MEDTLQETEHQILQAEKSFTDKAYDKAIAILENIIVYNPDNATAYRKLGGMYTVMNEPEKAFFYLEKAVSLNPKDTNNWLALGICYKKQQNWTKALESFQRSLQLSEKNIRTYQELFQIYRSLGQVKNALYVIQKLLQLVPVNINYLWEYAQLLKKVGNQEQALQQYVSIIENSKVKIPIRILMEWFELMHYLGYIGRTYSLLEKLYNEYAEDAGFLTLLASSYDYNNIKSYRSFILIEEAYKLQPKNPKTIFNLAKKYDEIGKKKEAKKYYEKTLKYDPLESRALSALSSVHYFLSDDDLFKKLKFAQKHHNKLSVERHIELQYALGKAYDDIGDFKTAFEHYYMGGKLNANGKEEADYTYLKQVLMQSKRVFSKEFFKQYNKQSCTSKKPIFIIGMPRSGTTLIEQVLSSINGVYGAGELYYIQEVLKETHIKGYSPMKSENNCMTSTVDVDVDFYEKAKSYLDYIEALAPKNSDYVIDKMPANFMVTGFLHLLFPNAMIIHSRRHPVEVCLSAYRIHFSNGQYWSDDLRTMGKYYRLYEELMVHWKNALPEGRILEVRYEDMVNSVEQESKRITHHMGIAWKPACLEFHKNVRTVRTASISQVRKPIYSDSVNRWSKYKPYLTPLLEEIGDLVDAYERELVADGQ